MALCVHRYRSMKFLIVISLLFLNGCASMYGASLDEELMAICGEEKEVLEWGDWDCRMRIISARINNLSTDSGSSTNSIAALLEKNQAEAKAQWDRDMDNYYEQARTNAILSELRQINDGLRRY